MDFWKKETRQMDRQMHSLRNRWFQGQKKTLQNVESNSGLKA